MLTQIAKVIWEGMPMSLGFWEWGMSKRGNAYVTVTGAPLQFLTKKPLPPPPPPPLGAIAHVVIIIEE